MDEQRVEDEPVDEEEEPAGKAEVADEAADGAGGSVLSKLDVSGTQVCASTLASVSAAVVASVFGVTGTVVGAALVSIVATVGSAAYSHGIRQTSEKLQQTPMAELIRPGAGGLTRRFAAPMSARDGEDGDGDRDRDGSGDESSGWRAWVAERHWGIVAGVAIVFAGSLLAVTMIELVGQQPLASLTGNDPSGNTSIGSFLDDGGKDGPDDDTTDTTVEPSDDSSPSGDADVDAPSDPDDPDVEPSTTLPDTTDESPDSTDPPSETSVPADDAGT